MSIHLLRENLFSSKLCFQSMMWLQTMPKPKNRAQSLSKPQQRKFLAHHIPGRIRSIRGILGDGTPDYLQLAGAAILVRSIAGFLGFSTRNGRLCQDHDYFSHESGQSWEVKLSDIDGGTCLKVTDLTATERTSLEAGINETNRAFAHLTFWDDPANQDAGGQAKERYTREQLQRIQRFAETVIELYNRHTASLSGTA